MFPQIYSSILNIILSWSFANALRLYPRSEKKTLLAFMFLLHFLCQQTDLNDFKRETTAKCIRNWQLPWNWFQLSSTFRFNGIDKIMSGLIYYSGFVAFIKITMSAYNHWASRYMWFTYFRIIVIKISCYYHTFSEASQSTVFQRFYSLQGWFAFVSSFLSSPRWTVASPRLLFGH